jgi:hypothetical protein
VQAGLEVAGRDSLPRARAGHRLVLDNVEPIAVTDLCRSECLYRAKVGKRLVVCTKRLNKDVGGAVCKMRLDAIANPILSAPCDTRVD